MHLGFRSLEWAIVAIITGRRTRRLFLGTRFLFLSGNFNTTHIILPLLPRNFIASPAFSVLNQLIPGTLDRREQIEGLQYHEPRIGVARLHINSSRRKTFAPRGAIFRQIHRVISIGVHENKIIVFVAS